MAEISNKLLTYSLLAHINDHNSGIKDLGDLFIPLVKRILTQMANKGIKSGAHISEIKKRVDIIYHLDIPFPLLSKIIEKIAEEVSSKSDSSFIVYHDKAFSINNYSFTDFEDEIEEEQSNIAKLEELYRAYIELNEIKDTNSNSLFEFIDKNRTQLVSFFTDKDTISIVDKDFSIQANFINSLKSDKRLYKIICKIYLGSIIVSYLEFEPEHTKERGDKEFLVDTNFLIGLLDLNTIESTHTCRKIIEICQRLNYKITVLDMTIEETRNLIERTSNSIDSTFLQKTLDPESIYNACERRKLSKTDLEKLFSNLETIFMKDYGLNIVSDSTKFRNEARYSKEFEIYKKIRQTEWSALHDATAIKYIQKTRGKKYKDYFSSNCFFVTNTGREFKDILHSESVPEIIRAEDLVNILWLTNPNVKLNINNSEVVDIGLSRLISSTINSKLPSSKIIKELDDNIQKYARDKISDKDIIRVANRIANKTLSNLEGLNKIASESPADFVVRLSDEARKEELREKKLEGSIRALLTEIQDSSDKRIKLKEEEYKKEYLESLSKIKSDKETEINAITSKGKSDINYVKLESLKKLDITKESLDKIASNKALFTIGLFLIPPIILLLLIHFFFDSRILSTLSLIGIFVWPVIAFIFYAISKKEWKLKYIHQSVAERYRLKYYTKFGFDLNYYDKLKKELEQNH